MENLCIAMPPRLLSPPLVLVLLLFQSTCRIVKLRRTTTKGIKLRQTACAFFPLYHRRSQGRILLFMDSIKVEKKDFDMKKFCFCLLSAYTKEGFCNPFFKHFFASIIEMGESCQMAWHKYARKKSYRARRDAMLVTARHDALLETKVLLWRRRQNMLCIHV